MRLIEDVYDAGYADRQKERGYDPEGSEAVAAAKEDRLLLQKEIDMYFDRLQKMRAALDLAKKMIIANGLDIPKTMTVINEALDS